MIDEVVLKFYKGDLAFVIRSGGDWRFAKSGVKGFALASGKVAYVDNVMGDGGKIKNVRLTRVDRTVKTYYMHRDENAAARRDFMSFFTPRQKYKIYMTYMGETRWAEGVLYKLQLTECLDDTDLMGATMTFAFESPLWKSVDDFGKDIAAVTEMWAFPWQCKLGSEGNPVGVYNFDRKVNMFNDGDVAAYPTVIITAKDYCENPMFFINDARVKINDIMMEGDEIVLDLGALPPRVEKNGENYFGHADKSSEFTKMYLDIGDNICAFDADNGSDNIAVTVFYNKMYTVI